MTFPKFIRKIFYVKGELIDINLRKEAWTDVAVINRMSLPGFYWSSFSKRIYLSWKYWKPVKVQLISWIVLYKIKIHTWNSQDQDCCILITGTHLFADFTLLLSRSEYQNSRTIKLFRLIVFYILFNRSEFILGNFKYFSNSSYNIHPLEGELTVGIYQLIQPHQNNYFLFLIKSPVYFFTYSKYFNRIFYRRSRYNLFNLVLQNRTCKLIEKIKIFAYSFFTQLFVKKVRYIVSLIKKHSFVLLHNQGEKFHQRFQNFFTHKRETFMIFCKNPS